MRPAWTTSSDSISNADDAARRHYCSKKMRKEPVAIVVEIQYMLQCYFDMRKYTHTWYKIVRAEEPEALVLDYNS